MSSLVMSQVITSQMVSIDTVSQPCHITTTQDHTLKWVLSDQYLTETRQEIRRGKDRYARFEFFFSYQTIV